MPAGKRDRPIALIVAVAENGVIGRDGDMPWYLPTDFRFFKEKTMGCPMIMGRRTFQAIGRPLPGRLNIVVTRDGAFRSDGIETATTLDTALRNADRWAESHGADEVFVIGGGEIYRQTMALADRIYLTKVHMSPEGETTFPEIDSAAWEKTEETFAKAGPKDSADMSFITFNRRQDPA